MNIYKLSNVTYLFLRDVYIVLIIFMQSNTYPMLVSWIILPSKFTASHWVAACKAIFSTNTLQVGTEGWKNTKNKISRYNMYTCNVHKIYFQNKKSIFKNLKIFLKNGVTVELLANTELPQPVIKRFVRASRPTVVQFRRSLAPFASSQCQVRSSLWGYHSLRQCSFHVVEGDVTALANRLGRLRGPAPHETDVCHLLLLSSALWGRQTLYVHSPNGSRNHQPRRSKVMLRKVKWYCRIGTTPSTVQAQLCRVDSPHWRCSHIPRNSTRKEKHKICLLWQT